MRKGKSRIFPLLALLIGGAVIVSGATLWLLSLTATVSLVQSPYYTKAFSDDSCTLPITSIAFGAIPQLYSGDAIGAWIPVTLQYQAVQNYPDPKVYIHSAITGSLPIGATIEIQKQAYDLGWTTTTLLDAGNFFIGAGMGNESPKVGGFHVQRLKYRIVFASGIAPVSGSFGIQFTIADA